MCCVACRASPQYPPASLHSSMCSTPTEGGSSMPDSSLAVANTSATGVFDLRHWIDQARAMDQLKDVSGADVKFEIGALTDLNAKRGGPALLFDHCAGYQD